MTLRTIHSTLAFSAAVLLLVGCAGGADQASPDEELSPGERLLQEAGVTIEPGLAGCDFNNDPDNDSGANPYAPLDRAELREEEDAYVVTFTGDFFDPEVLLADDTNVSLHIILSGEDFMAPAPNLITTFWDGEVSASGVTKEQDLIEQETGARIEDGLYTATFSKESPHLVDFEVDMWAASVYFDDGDERPVSFRCGDGRSWDWEPLD